MDYKKFSETFRQTAKTHKIKISEKSEANKTLCDANVL